MDAEKYGRHKAGYPTGKRIKPTHGDLYLDGFLHLTNLPLALLQSERTKLLRKGYFKKRIKIKYH